MKYYNCCKDKAFFQKLGIKIGYKDVSFVIFNHFDKKVQ